MNLNKNTKDFYEGSAKKFGEIRSHMMRLTPFWIAGTATGVIATIYAKLFGLAENLSEVLMHQSGIWYMFIPPAFFLLSWILVEMFAPKANGSGIPQLMASVELTHLRENGPVDSLLGFRIIVVKVLSSLAVVIGGGAIGREGPTLQISGSIFHLMSKNWKWGDIQSRSAFLLAGAASGLASAFNTPLGGIVYVIEELAKSHFTSFRTGVLHSVIFAGIISQIIMGPYLYFGYPTVLSFQSNKVWQYFLIAVGAALMVVGFSQLLKFIVSFRTRLKTLLQKGFFALMTGFLFAAVVLFFSKSGMGPGNNLLNDLLFKSELASTTDVFSRLFGTVLTYASGGAGGIFAPTLSLGGSIASLSDQLLGFQLGSLAVLIGMASGLAALTHSPFTSFILILEMTDRHSSIIPLMIAAITGHGISKFLSDKSFYETVFDNLMRELSNGESETPK